MLGVVVDDTLECSLNQAVGLTSQAEVDAFASNLPGCNTIPGTLEITGEDVTNLDGLLGIQRIEGNLKLIAPNLEDISGLSELLEITGRLNVGYPSGTKIRSLEPLSKLSVLGNGVAIYDNDELLNVDGLSGVTVTALDLWINGNEQLNDLSGFRISLN